MMVTSDSTALMVMNTATNTATSICRSAPNPRRGRGAVPTTRLTIRNMITGMPTVPNRPIGSRVNILISSQVSFSSPRTSVPDRVAGQLQIHVLERRQDRAEIGDSDAMLGDAANHVGDQVFTRAANRVARSTDRDLVDARQRLKLLRRPPIVGDEHDGPLGCVPRDQPFGTVDVDHPPVLDDRHAIAQPLRLFHQVRGE